MLVGASLGLEVGTRQRIVHFLMVNNTQEFIQDGTLGVVILW